MAGTAVQIAGGRAGMKALVCSTAKKNHVLNLMTTPLPHDLGEVGALLW